VPGPRTSPYLLLRRGQVLLGGALLHLLVVAGFAGSDWSPLAVGAVLALTAAAGEEARAYWLAAAAFGVWGVLAAADVVPAAGEPGFWTLGLGLLGALHVLAALNPGGRGGT
jgi:hypothetical protein